MNTKLHAVTDADGRPIRFFMTAGQVSDYTGAAALLGSLPKADWLLADRGYDADWFREALKDKGIRVACLVPSRGVRILGAGSGAAEMSGSMPMAARALSEELGLRRERAAVSVRP